MNTQAAKELVEIEVRRLQQLPYAELVALLSEVGTKELQGTDGKLYQLEAQAFWDSVDGGDLKVIVSADDGGLRAFFPLTNGFTVRPDGTLVD